ncbi:MAG: apolipoprotein N-acyltransferase, partial [bacterium]
YRKQQLQWYRDKTRQNIDADLIVWPETAIPALAHQVKTFLEELDLWAGQHDQGIILGVPVLDQTVMYNSMIGLGRAQGIYRKMHLVPLGEYFPLKSILRLLPGLDIPLSDMQPGESAQKGIVFDNQNTAISICYEDVFAGEMMPWVQNSGFLINASNDAWFGDLAPYQHLQMARMRALESGRPMIRATNTGISAFIDEKGWVIHQSKLNQAEVLKSEVQYFQGETPYMLIKDYWVILFCALFLLSGYLPMLKKIEDRCQLAIKTVNK